MKAGVLLDNTIKYSLLIIGFHGKVGQSVRLTRERSPVRAWVEPFCIVSVFFAVLTSHACGSTFMYLHFLNLSSESIMWLAFVGKLVNPFA
jgi:hypothetical protein